MTHRKLTVEKKIKDFGKGYPGWNESAQILWAGREIAYASWPNTDGPVVNGFESLRMAKMCPNKFTSIHELRAYITREAYVHLLETIVRLEAGITVNPRMPARSTSEELAKS